MYARNRREYYMKNFLEVLASIGLFATGTDAIADVMLKSLPAEFHGTLQTLFIVSGLLLFVHVAYKFLKEN